MKMPVRNRTMAAGLGGVVCAALVLWGLGGGSTAPRVAATAPTPPVADLWQLSLRTGVALAAIVALILGAAALVRRFGVSPARRAAGVLQVVDRLDLAPKRALYSVRAGGRVVVVGVTESNITPVIEWSAEDSARLYPPAAPVPAPAFASLLQGALTRAKHA